MVSAPLASLVRDRVTLVIGGSYVLLGSALGALGPVGDQLRKELHLSGTVTGVHGAMFGWFLIVFAIAATAIQRRVPAAGLLRLAVVLIGSGFVVVAVGRRVELTLLGALLIGAGGAALVVVAPQLLGAHHGPDDRASAFTFVNALSQMGSISAPLAIALALHEHWGWRWPMALIGIVVGVVVFAAALRTEQTSPAAEARNPVGPVRLLVHIREARLRWTVLVLGIGVEFAMLFWGSTSLQAFTGATASSGAVGVGLFAGGMVAGRLLGPNLLSKADDVRVLRWSFIVATGGLVLIRVGPGLGVRLGAFAVVGLGLSLVYPLAFSRLYGSGLPDASVGAVGALASGAAITLSPPALGGLADVLDLRRAVLIVPLMALGALVLTVPRAEQPAS